MALVGFAGFIISALTMVVLYVTTVTSALGFWGLLVGVISSPAAAFFPFLDWLVEGRPSTLYVAIWSAGVAGMVVSMWWKWWSEHHD